MFRGMTIQAPVLAILFLLIAVQILALYITPSKHPRSKTNSIAHSDGKTLNKDKNLLFLFSSHCFCWDHGDHDAISVYKTGHMVSLAEIMIKIKAPLLFVLPKSTGHSFRRDRVFISSKKDRRIQEHSP
jgi:hypothetical protein